MNFNTFLPLLVAFVCGLGLGAFYLWLLQIGVRCLLHDTRPGLGSFLSVVRLGVVGVGLWMSVQFGAVTLLGTLVGFTVVRVYATRKMRASSSWS